MVRRTLLALLLGGLLFGGGCLINPLPTPGPNGGGGGAADTMGGGDARGEPSFMDAAGGADAGAGPEDAVGADVTAPEDAADAGEDAPGSDATDETIAPEAEGWR